MRAGRFELPGNVSSQYISGLLLAAPLLDGDSQIAVTGEIESRPYIGLTLAVLNAVGVKVGLEEGATPGGLPLTVVTIERHALVIEGREQLDGGRVNSRNDHRIAMMAASAAVRCASPVAIEGAEAVDKSYPLFFEHYRLLGGDVELIDE